MTITRLEQLRREQTSADMRQDAVRDLEELGDDAAYAADRLLGETDDLVDGEREALRIKVRFNCLRLATMQERGAPKETAMRLIDSLTEIERIATIEAFNAGVRG